MSCKSGSKKEEQRHKKTGLLRSARAQKRETKGCKGTPTSYIGLTHLSRQRLGFRIQVSKRRNKVVDLADTACAESSETTGVVLFIAVVRLFAFHCLSFAFRLPFSVISGLPFYCLVFEGRKGSNTSH